MTDSVESEGVIYAQGICQIVGTDSHKTSIDGWGETIRVVDQLHTYHVSFFCIKVITSVLPLLSNTETAVSGSDSVNAQAN